MLQECAQSIRRLAKQPGYALSIILTLALGIGASAAMFCLVDAALLRPLPFAQPDRLVMLTGVAGPQRLPRGASYPEVLDWRAMNATLQEVASYDQASLNLRLDAETVLVQAELVSPSYFQLLGANAETGRTFLPEENATPNSHPVAVVSRRFWRDRLGSDPNVLGRALTLNDRQVQIVGVMPDAFAGVSFNTDVWVPSLLTLTSSPATMQGRGNRWLFAIGRLKDGVSLARCQEDLSRVAALLERQYPEFNRQRGVDVTTLQQALLGGTDTQVEALSAAVLLFLTVACANAACLQLVNANARRRELALRFALGARPGHVLRQLLTESVVLSLVAGTLGALAAAWGTTAAVALMPLGALPQYVHPAVDARTVLFTFGISIVVATVVAAFPAASASRSNLMDVMKEGGRTLESGLGAIKRVSTQQLLVIVEIAAAMVLLTVAGLVVRSLARQSAVSLGMDPRGVTVARVSLPGSRYAPEQRTVFVERLEQDLRAMAGVRSVAISSDLPFSGAVTASSLLPDVASTPDARLRYYRHYVTPEFFSTLGIPIVAGRVFTAQDRRGAPTVAIINDAAAVRIWGTSSAVGRRFFMGSDNTPVEVVGVARTARFRDLTTDLARAGTEPDVYFPYAQLTDRDIEIAVRTADGRPVPFDALQEAVRRLDEGLPIYQVRLLEDAVRQQTSSGRFVSALLTMFSGGALVLAAIGLYGLVAYVVGLSRREIAIRLALGADRRQVAGLIIRNGMILVAAGVAAGIAGALVSARAIQTQLFQTNIADPVTYAVVASVLLIVAFVASLVPTRRAVRLDPHSALRAE